ncbi:hypothetical protein MM1218R_03701 [Mycobacterium marinum]|nr:hypothetical protein MM1218R_03701 [Mycobacterium marinum]
MVNNADKLYMLGRVAESAVARLDRSATHVLDSARGTALASPGCALPRAVSSPGGQLAGLDVWPGDELVKLSGCFAASSSAAKVWKSVLPAAAVLLPLRDRTRDGAVARTGWSDTPATSEHLDQTAPMRSADQSERN